MCQSYNRQYGTDYIAVMPTNLYGPRDNFNLATSHVLPAMIRKMHLAKQLMAGNWSAIRQDLKIRPVENINEQSSEAEIISVLSKYGIVSNTLTLWGSGTPMREFLWSEDMADASVYILENVDFKDLKGTDEKVRNCHINIGTGVEISIKELADIIKHEIGYEGEICWDTSKPDGTMRKLCNVDKLHALGWQHSVEIEEGIKRIYKWYLSEK